MRGMQSKETTQKIIEAMRIHYNFCREHSKLGKTPAEAVGPNIDFKGNKRDINQNCLEAGVDHK